jgi:sugar lactone lactonase YvrE
VKNCRLLEVREGGEIVTDLDLGDVHPAAAAFGGEDGRTLYLTTSLTGFDPKRAKAAMTGAVRVLRTIVPGIAF